MIEPGSYKRELWLAEHVHSARPLRDEARQRHALVPFAPMMRTVDEALIATRRFRSPTTKRAARRRRPTKKK